MPIRTEVHAHIAEVVIHHPPVNALDSATWNELARIIGSVGCNPDVRVMLIRAEGKGFCAVVELNRGNYLTFKAIRTCEVPVLAAVHGFVIGGGIGICGASDVIIASGDAYFSLPEIDRGAMGGAAHLSRMLPLHKVRAAFFTGAQVPATEAWRLGAIEKVVPREKLLEEARAFAAVIAGKSRTALRLAKEALNGIEAIDVDRAYRFEQGFTLEMYMHEDSRRARASFVERKSKADFQEPI
jgi:enoyl-CoA hydratase